MTTTPRSFLAGALVVLVIATPLAWAQTPAPSVAPVRVGTDTTAAKPATPPAPTPPPSPVQGIRNKVSAGDLLSAESILEVHRERHGENGAYLVGLSWLARGALLLGDLDKAKAYTNDVRARCDQRKAVSDTLERDREYETALGAALEVEAQLLERTKNAGAGAAFLRTEIPKVPGPVSLRSRLHKRLDMLSMVGEKAPEIVVEDRLGEAPPALVGQPTIVFIWAEWCGDARAQVASLSRAMKKYQKDGVRAVALTRYYEPDSLRLRERARVDSVWKADYKDLAQVPVVISTASMERYGGSSSPTFVFVDRTGIVRRYTPTRLTEAEIDRSLAALVK